MSTENTIRDFIIDTQIEMFSDVREQEQKTLDAIAKDCKANVSTIGAWASGQNALTLFAVKVLLRADYMAPYLSRLFEPELHALKSVMAIDHDDTAGKCIDYSAEYAKARHPASEWGVDIGPTEEKRLKTKAARLRAVA